MYMAPVCMLWLLAPPRLTPWALARAVEGLMYMAPACMLWLLLGVALVEWPRIAAENALGLMVAKPGLYLCAAAMGFGVNSLAYIVIQLASSLTLKVGAGLPRRRPACKCRRRPRRCQGACRRQAHPPPTPPRPSR